MKRTHIMLSMMTAASHLFANTRECVTPQNCNQLRYWLDASFTYWFAKEDGLNVAESAQVNSAATTILANSPKVFQQEFGYHPGFKLGVGLSSQEDWELYGEYTFYHGENHVSRNAPAGSTGTGVWSLDNWYLQQTFFSHQSLTGTKLSSTWKLTMNMLDLLLSRPLSENQGGTGAFLGGLRTVWIQQEMNLKLNVAASSFGGTSFLGPQPVASKNQSDAWGIGPHLGLNGRYNLPMCFGLTGEIGTTLFFTQFTRVKHSEGVAATYYQPPRSIKMSYDCVRPELDLSLGLSWKRTINAKQSFNLLASYDFSYFWGQNMMRSLMDEYISGVSSGSLDLYFQGLTLTAAYGF